MSLSTAATFPNSRRTFRPPPTVVNEDQRQMCSCSMCAARRRGRSQCLACARRKFAYESQRERAADNTVVATVLQQRRQELERERQLREGNVTGLIFGGSASRQATNSNNQSTQRTQNRQVQQVQCPSQCCRLEENARRRENEPQIGCSTWRRRPRIEAQEPDVMRDWLSV